MGPGQRAVVTGGASGLGQAFCEELARRGARVLVADVDLAGAERVAAAIGQGARAARCDVSRLEDVEALAVTAREQLGGVDLVINNAGVSVGGRVGEVPIEDWRWMMGVNLWGVIHGCHVFAPLLRAQQRGHIVNVASFAGLAGFPGLAAYSTSKWAVVGLSESLYAELAGDGVGVTVVCPGLFPTNIFKNARVVDREKVEAGFAKMMEASKLTAAEVARKALDGAEDGKLHVIPGADTRLVWRLKRLMPARFYPFVGKLIALGQKREAKKLATSQPR